MDKPTLVLQGKDVLEAINKGVEAIVKPVAGTYGPDAGTTLMYRSYNRGPRCVDDGYYTAEVIEPKNPFVRLASGFFKEGIKRTNEKVGDGTSTTALVGGALWNKVYRMLLGKIQGYQTKTSTGNGGVMEIKRDILKKAGEVKELIRKAAKPVKTQADLERISAISLGEENETSKKIAQMTWEVGNNGFIDVVEGYKGEVETEVIKGARFPAKMCGKAFVNKPEKYEMVVEECPVFITNHKMDSEMMMKIVVSKCESAKAIFIAPDFSPQVLVNMVMARQNGAFLWPVKVPSLRTEELDDLATFFGAKFINKDAGMKLQSVVWTDYGAIDKLIVKDSESKEDAVAIGGKGEKNGDVAAKIEILQAQMAETKEDKFKKLLQRRIASMASSGGVIRVGASTDAESLPLKLKVEDCVYACKAALKSGYVKGGGLCLKEIAEGLDDEHILREALLASHKQIQENTGGIVIGKDVIDPADAVYYAVEHATSVVSSLITVKTMVAEPNEMQNGEGDMAIASALKENTKYLMKKDGVWKENEDEVARDNLGGMTEDEFIRTNND